MNVPEISKETAERWNRIQLEGLAQEPCTCENDEDYCRSCEAREELRVIAIHEKEEKP